MTNYLYYTQGKKHIIEVDGWMYAIYKSSPYHLYEYNARGWVRINAPRSQRLVMIGRIFGNLQYIAKNKDH